MGIRKLVKFLIVRNLLYEIGLKDIILLKILQEESENQYHIEFIRKPSTRKRTLKFINNILKIYLCILSIFKMPMRLKSKLYKKEQEEVMEKIISILDLKNKKTYTLYELDKNEEIQNKITELIPEIRKWFSFNGLKAVGEPSKIKRPWLSIIKQLLKSKYNIESKDFQFTENGKYIRTHIYSFNNLSQIII